MLYQVRTSSMGINMKQTYAQSGQLETGRDETTDDRVAAKSRLVRTRTERAFYPCPRAKISYMSLVDLRMSRDRSPSLPYCRHRSAHHYKQYAAASGRVCVLRRVPKVTPPSSEAAR